MSKLATIVTHSGSFHADEIFGVATISLHLNSKIKIIRTRDPKFFQTADYIVDVGTIYDPKRNRFDHHQEGGAGRRKNKIPYASFGLVWKKFVEKICGSKKIADIIERKLVEPVDAIDNGVFFFEANGSVRPYFIEDCIQAFCPTWKETKYPIDKAFFYLVGVAEKLIKREIIRVENKQEGMKIVERVYSKTKNKRLVIVDEHYPYRDILSKHKQTLFIVRPEMGKMAWRVEAIPETPHTFVYQKLFPKKWAGKKDEELARISGVKDAVFCHNNRFIAVAKSKEGALKLAQLALRV